MRIVALASFVAVVACSSNPAPSTQGPEAQTVRVATMEPGTGSGSGLRVTSSTMSKIDTLATSFDRVWKELPAVYGALEIPIERFDAAQNIIGNSAYKVYRRLGKVPMTRYVDCGSTQIGPNADSYEIMLSVLTKVQRLRSDTASATIGTTVEAMARPVQFRGDYVRCTSKGELEKRLAEVLKIRLAP